MYPYRSLKWLNELPDADAEAVFLSCAGSQAWARTMTELRPFRILEDMFAAAERVWHSLPAGEWLSAFESCESGECECDGSGGVFMEDLHEAAGLYHDKFGFSMVTNGRKRSAVEMLHLYRTRLGNSPRREFVLAGEEYGKIIESRLTGVLER